MSVQVRNLFHTYFKKTSNETASLKNINLDFDGHFFTAIIGKTGSGKSTLIQHLNALIVPQEGEVVVDEFVINNKKHKNIKNLRKHVGLVFQFAEAQLFEETVEKDVAFGPKNFGINKDEAIKQAHEALLSVGLDESYFQRSPIELSGGEKRRVALAGIIAINPDILVLDEPTAGLDHESKIEVLQLINKLYESGKNIILVTHDMDIVLNNCHKAVLLSDGEVQFEGNPHVLFTDGSFKGTPRIYRLINELKTKGLDFTGLNICNCEQFAQEFAKRRKNNG